MPARDNHLHQAQHNEAFVASFNLDSTAYLDWAVTGIFYAALHFYNQYRALKTRSENARYDLQRFSPVEVRELISAELQAVKSHISQLLQRP